MSATAVARWHRPPLLGDVAAPLAVVEASAGTGKTWFLERRVVDLVLRAGATIDQILVVTSGSGIVATEHEQREINVGDVAHIKAGERHWHGAKADTTMGHITVTLVGSKAVWG